jgi:predicted nuclease with TOPRIM domain
MEEKPHTRSPPGDVDFLKLAERALEVSRRERQRIEASMPKLSQEWSQVNARLTELAHATETMETMVIDSQPGEPLDSSGLAEDFALAEIGLQE